MANIHHSAATGFANSAATYVRGRPEYPREADDWLRSDLGLGTGKAALDLGAGTGKFLARLRVAGATLSAVEPVPAMLEQLVATNLDVVAKLGSAEHIPFSDCSFDVVICAQAFHWFATAEALAEIRRVLTPGGALGLIWNVRDESVGWVAALSEIIRPYERDVPRYHTQEWRRRFPADGFSPIMERRFPNAHRGPPEQVIVDRVLSISVIAALPIEQQALVASQIRDLIIQSPELASRSVVTFPYYTAAFSCRRIG
jgi:SAM-dependent methyltransferase